MKTPVFVSIRDAETGCWTASDWRRRLQILHQVYSRACERGDLPDVASVAWDGARQVITLLMLTCSDIQL